MQTPADPAPRLFQVLLVEDNPGDVQLTRIALEESKLAVHLNIVHNGVEALAYLRKQAPYLNTPPTDLVLLDLNLPKMDGREVLTEMKADPHLKRIPVVILTTSEAEEDILKTYNQHANCYIVKPVDFHQFVKIVQSIGNFWFTLVKLPPE
ncbi:response regulator [Synechococcales cyanobacterium C]|uniref:Response regulator n=1 Tax=Petrachloros mirabilis ULC683 TaxID=2781853 RepID=A0A8K2A6R6_9CYAN|nr:response regulator [Petrachloros mirabilis]NCJ06274.1 response regulator [Petrachloros mirabilis ULC683]